MIYTIPEEEEPISSCALESESIFNPDSNSDNNDDKNTGSSSVQYGDNNDNNSNSDLNSDSDFEQYIALLDLAKEQELKWFSDNNEGIMPECTHDTDARFNLRYLGKDAIQLEPHSRICIDLKIALEILATTIINIRRGIINTGYIGNIIAMLQNDSEKTYIIKPNKKIVQAIFLPLVKIAQLISVGNRKELEITARGIQKFGSTVISTGQTIFISSYSQYILAIERKEKEHKQIFEAEAILCELGEIGLINLHIPAKSHNHIKIPIYNNTRNVVKIPKGTTLRYLTMEIEDQTPSSISDFP
ncbi:hypothetical protein G9A89_018675 [Geosiphon pyriformis]|nr:hypothetical protein G9A89_018675 [Geosiphon pyriformis]